MENIFKDNLIYLRESRNETQVESATALGLSRSTYANYEAGDNFPKADVMMKIIGHFGVSFEKLMSENLQNAHLTHKTPGVNLQANAHLNAHQSAHPKGENKDISPVVTGGDTAQNQAVVKEIFKPVMVTVDHVGRDNVVMVPIKARAGYLLGYGDPEYISSLPSYRMPGLGPGLHRAFEVQGLSMYETLNSSDVVIGSYVEQARDVKDNRIYVFVTKDDGILIKRALNRVESDGKFVLKSDNTTDRGLYPNIVLDADQINEIWDVKLYASRYLRSPSSVYDRLADLEAKYTILEHQYKLLTDPNNP